MRSITNAVPGMASAVPTQAAIYCDGRHRGQTPPYHARELRCRVFPRAGAPTRRQTLPGSPHEAFRRFVLVPCLVGDCSRFGVALDVCRTIVGAIWNPELEILFGSDGTTVWVAADLRRACPWLAVAPAVQSMGLQYND